MARAPGTGRLHSQVCVGARGLGGTLCPFEVAQTSFCRSIFCTCRASCLCLSWAQGACTWAVGRATQASPRAMPVPACYL